MEQAHTPHRFYVSPLSSCTRMGGSQSLWGFDRVGKRVRRGRLVECGTWFLSSHEQISDPSIYHVCHWAFSAQIWKMPHGQCRMMCDDHNTAQQPCEAMWWALLPKLQPIVLKCSTSQHSVSVGHAFTSCLYLYVVLSRSTLTSTGLNPLEGSPTISSANVKVSGNLHFAAIGQKWGSCPFPFYLFLKCRVCYSPGHRSWREGMICHRLYSS